MTDLLAFCQAPARRCAGIGYMVRMELGSPKQDLWMARYPARLAAPLPVGVGAAFDFLSGRQAQAPRWTQRSGLEWLFRLVREPGRMLRRYLVYNPKFLFHVAESSPA